MASSHPGGGRMANIAPPPALANITPHSARSAPLLFASARRALADRRGDGFPRGMAGASLTIEPSWTVRQLAAAIERLAASKNMGLRVCALINPARGCAVPPHEQARRRRSRQPPPTRDAFGRRSRALIAVHSCAARPSARFSSSAFSLPASHFAGVFGVVSPALRRRGNLEERDLEGFPLHAFGSVVPLFLARMVARRRGRQTLELCRRRALRV